MTIHLPAATRIATGLRARAEATRKRRTLLLVLAVAAGLAAARLLLASTTDTRLEIVEGCIAEVSRDGMGEVTNVGDAICIDEYGRARHVPEP